MGYVALKRLRWGEETILPGEAVPADGEEGRSYASLLSHGLIAEADDTGAGSDAKLSKHAKGLQEKLDAAHRRIAELELAASAAEAAQTKEEAPKAKAASKTSEEKATPKPKAKAASKGK